MSINYHAGVRRRRATMVFSAVISLMVSLTGYAQQPGTAAAPPVDAGVSTPPQEIEITVTASRAAKDGSTAPTPTTVVGAADLQLQGATNVGDIMSSVPQFQGSTTSTTTQFGGSNFGGNYFNLRGLGIDRTLVLIDGRRVVATDNTGSVDANVIPVALIDRVEVVTGGASADWGSDAVAGVVNIILKKDLDGFQASVQRGGSTHGDDRDTYGSLDWGTAFADGRGHIEIAGEVDHNDGVLHQYDRSWASGNYGVLSNPAYAPGNGQSQLLIVPNYQLTLLSENGLITSGPLRGTEFQPGGGTRQFVYGNYAGFAMSGGSGVSLERYTPLALPYDRYNTYSRLSFDLTPAVSAFVEASYSYCNTNVSQMIIPLYLGSIPISADNAYLPASVRNALAAAGQTSFKMGRLSTDFGGVGQEGSEEPTRIVGGFKGTFGGGWDWNAYYEYGRSRFDSVEYGNPINANFALATDAVVNPATGNVVCRSTLTNPTNGCVPVNLFGFGSPSQAAINYITGISSISQHVTEHVASADIRGEPLSTWAGSVSTAGGLEYRSEELTSEVDSISDAGGFLYGNPQPTSGKYDVKEAFVDTIVPLAKDTLFARSLDLNGAVRYTDYSLSGEVTSWKIGLTYQPIDDVRFRAARSRDIRAANFSELFTTPRQQLATITEGSTSTTANVFITGNTSLKPESADTTTFGVVFQPTWWNGFHASVDYFDIKINDAIGTFSAQQEVTLCDSGANTFCSLIERSANGTVTGVTTQYVNFSSFQTRGIDYEGNYLVPIDHIFANFPGALRLRLLATWVDELITTTGATSIDRAGEVGPNNGGLPHWRGNIAATYDQGPFTGRIEWRWVGGGNYDNTYNSTNINDNRISGRNYTDISFQYKPTVPVAKDLEFYALVHNLFDTSPPIAPQNFLNPTQTNPALYDVIGRTIAVGARVKF